jgi:hypothetical protein
MVKTRVRRLPLAGAATVLLVLSFLGCNTSPDGSHGYSREDALARLRVVNDLKMMALSMISYQDQYLHFPPADGAVEAAPPPDRVSPRKDVPGQEPEPKLVGLSWRAYLLPLMDSDTNPIREKEVYRNLRDGKYPPVEGAKPSESWNRPGLKTLSLSPFKPSVEGRAKEPWDTYYRVLIGNGAAFEPNKQLSLQDFTDGAGNTILIVEAGEAVPWPKPDELAYDPNKPLPKLGGQFADGFYAAFADGTVHFIRKDADDKLIRALITCNGGEKIDVLPPAVDSQALYAAAGLK